MSLDLARQTDREHPDLLRENTNATCYQFVVALIQKLRAEGASAHLVCKTRGEGQYTPPDFTPFEVVGLDAKRYWCTGVSHDAIWCNGLQVDTIGRGNDAPEPIFNPDGSRMTGVPAWNPIPREHWRPNNPPYLLEGASPPPPSQTPPAPQIPSYSALGDDIFFRVAVGVPLFADYATALQPPNDGMAVWFSRAIYRVMAAQIRANGGTVDAPAEIKIVRNEWRALLGLPPL